MCHASLLCATIAVTTVSTAQFTPNEWSRADASIVRLAPRTFNGVPAGIRNALVKRGCTIPQPTGSKRARNVVSGRFTQRTRTEWAALCSRSQRSSILVFHDNDFTQADEFGEAADADYLQTGGNDQLIFSRALTTASSRVIRLAQSGETTPLLVIDHDGIDDAFEGKASTIWYWSEGGWIRLKGSE